MGRGYCRVLRVFLALCTVSSFAFAGEPTMRAVRDAQGQVVLLEGDAPVLRYNDQTVTPTKEQLAKISAGNRKYAQPRSDYIHPLYGPDGEALTSACPRDHPHHRGIYWAWPEVQYKGKTHDLHALQGVFARPTGNIELHGGDDLAEVIAENRWMWEDSVPIVRELVTIRAHKADASGRHVDLRLEFTALVDGVTLARRETTTYGGLNIRLSPAKRLNLLHFADPPGAKPRMAWSDSIGTWQGGKRPVGFAVFEKQANPEYPGDYVEYRNLPWFQPTFPRAGSRYVLVKGKPLVLEYRFWIRRADRTTEAEYRRQWTLFNTPAKD